MIFTLFTSPYKVLVPLIVLLTGVFLQDKLQYYYSKYVKNNQPANKDGAIAFSPEALAEYNGVTKKKLYMAVLGIVYDVSKSPQHYAKDSPYHYFIGKDGTRALVTGDFKEESENKDHVLDLNCNNIFSLLQWQESLETKYKKIGILTGRYYDSNGRSTKYGLGFKTKVKECNKEKELKKKQEDKYPPCNMAWNEQEGTKVWCTNKSGGSHRDWVGVPRQMYTPGDIKPRCVCLNTDISYHRSIIFKEYDNCSNTSAVCFVT